ncbi:MAG: hypothetical protein LBH19_11210 [Dysgonamonadaceae bacterium]|jgi:hypothetical protein|nr:hypothetical protein [Dysgonamonadaceae bacterium]
MKKSYFSRVLALCILGIAATVAFSQTNIVIEAENANVFHFAIPSNRAGFSNAKGVEMKSTNNAYVRYNVNVETEGAYNLAITYATMNVRSCYLQVNNQKPSLLVFDENSSDWNNADKSKSILIYLEAGNNVIELGAYEYSDSNNNTTQHAPVIDKLTITDSEQTIAKPADRITPVVVEAESSNAALKTGNASAVEAFSGFASGSGAKVGDNEYKYGSLTYENVTVPEAGTYDLTWYYASMGKRGIYIKVNGQKAIKSVLLEDSNSWGNDTPADVAGENGENAHSDNAPRTLAKTEQVYLKAGSNTIVLASLTTLSVLTTLLVDNGPNLDRFVIKSSPKTIEKPEELYNAYAFDYTDIRTGATINIPTTAANLNKLFDNDETTFFTSTAETQIEIALPYPVIVTSYSLAAGAGYDLSNVTIERKSGDSWLAINTSTELKNTTQPELVKGAINEYTTWLGTANKDRAGRYFRLTFAGENISVGEFQINGFPYVGDGSNDDYFPVDLTRDTGSAIVGTWSADQNGWNGGSDGQGGEGYGKIYDRNAATQYTAQAQKAYVEFDFNIATTISAYSICNRAEWLDRNPKNWTLYGYTTDDQVEELDYQAGITFSALLQNMVFKIQNPATYKRYRIYFTQNGGDGNNTNVVQFQLLAAYPAPADALILKIPADNSLSLSDNDLDLAGLVFNEGSQLIGAANLEVSGAVEVVKTFATDQWEPIGFPFDIESINVEYGNSSKTGIIYDGSGAITAGLAPADGNAATANIYAAIYDGDAFVYAGASTLSAGQAYIIEFPKSDFNNEASVTVTFTAATGTVLNTTGADPSIGSYTLIANPDLVSKSDFGSSYYYVLNAAHTVFEKATALDTPLKPFGAVIASVEGSKVSVGIDVATTLPVITKDSVIGREYYNLQGVKMAQPVKGQVYLVREVFASGAVSVSKFIKK